ncbi:MAG: hypothetical protein GF313_06720 [Caldithrix sp.]|nr:hypothetical protein [Caldithrix sp.]
MNQKLNNINEMKCQFLDENATYDFLKFLKGRSKVFAPHRKGEASYIYDEVSDVKDVVLQYPRTIQPLKKYFLPPRETLLSFNIDENNFTESEINVEPRIFFGIHAYEMEGVMRLDYTFEQGQPESNYLTRREQSTFIGISYEPDEYHFSKSLGIDIDSVDGFSLYFKKTDNGYYVYEIDAAGQQLMKEFGKGKRVDIPVTKEEPEFTNKIKYHYNRLPQIFEHVYDSKVWEEVAERCVGCGTCNLLCPTCYCFDVRDEVEINATEGKRERFWDGCMLNPFAEVAGNENFREKLSSRTRHRLYRKFKYITNKSGELHCVGCGRCSKYCPADISITKIINNLIDDYADRQQKQVI